ncbi:MAG: Pterin-4-alpha-carbinolamine dehydratase, partial [Nocardioides sp.]|nr:Pterin-4-alpha-carbinolamine dehydratase [Nocardioides sp.]
MNDPKQKLTPKDVEAQDLADWRILFSTLHARFRTGDFATGLRLVNLIGEEAESMNHHPDLDLSYPLLNVRLTSHDAGGVTDRDVRLARKISAFAADLGVSSEPGAVSVLELGLDTWDHAAIKPFWAAVLGMKDSAAPDELVDPDGALPTIWFQETDAHEEPRQRFHLDIRVPPEVAEDRVAAALAAGGTLVSDERAPTFWVLADAQGNKACVCTCIGR